MLKNSACYTSIDLECKVILSDENQLQTSLKIVLSKVSDVQFCSAHFALQNQEANKVFPEYICYLMGLYQKTAMYLTKCRYLSLIISKKRIWDSPRYTPVDAEKILCETLQSVCLYRGSTKSDRVLCFLRYLNYIICLFKEQVSSSAHVFSLRYESYKKSPQKMKFSS